MGLAKFLRILYLLTCPLFLALSIPTSILWDRIPFPIVIFLVTSIPAIGLILAHLAVQKKINILYALLPGIFVLLGLAFYIQQNTKFVKAEEAKFWEKPNVYRCADSTGFELSTNIIFISNHVYFNLGKLKDHKLIVPPALFRPENKNNLKTLRSHISAKDCLNPAGSTIDQEVKEIREP